MTLGSILLVIDVPLLLELTGGCVRAVVAGYSSGVKTEISQASSATNSLLKFPAGTGVC